MDLFDSYITPDSQNKEMWNSNNGSVGNRFCVL